MKVICELEIGNNQDHPDTKIILSGNPLQRSGFIDIMIGHEVYEVDPDELLEAIKRVKSEQG